MFTILNHSSSYSKIVYLLHVRPGCSWWTGRERAHNLPRRTVSPSWCGNTLLPMRSQIKWTRWASSRVAINCAGTLLIYKMMPVIFVREVMHMTCHTGLLDTITSMHFMCAEWRIRSERASAVQLRCPTLCACANARGLQRVPDPSL